MTEIMIADIPNTIFINQHLYTKNKTPNKSVYGEKLININNIEYRFWDPYRSKLAALILKGCKTIPITNKKNILYLGAASGTTVSHISDIIDDGNIFCVEFSSRSFRDLLKLAEQRKNIIPILEDAFHPYRYKMLVSKVDIIYQDLSQRDQVRAFVLNSNLFLKHNDFGIFMVKARSIDITKKPEQIFTEVIEELKQNNFKIIEEVKLEPFSKDHMAIIIQTQGQPI